MVKKKRKKRAVTEGVRKYLGDEIVIRIKPTIEGVEVWVPEIGGLGMVYYKIFEVGTNPMATDFFKNKDFKTYVDQALRIAQYESSQLQEKMRCKIEKKALKEAQRLKSELEFNPETTTIPDWLPLPDWYPIPDWLPQK